MWQSIGPLALLVGLLALLPWGLRWLQRLQRGKAGGVWLSSDLISSVAVGPQQRVVTVEVGPPHARTWLVLGVTAQQVTCLQSFPVVAAGASSTEAAHVSFAAALAASPAGSVNDGH